MLINAFFDYLSLEKKYSKHTVSAYKNDLMVFKSFLDSEYGVVDMREVEYNQIRFWIVDLVNREISNRSINRKISTLKTFYKFLQKIDEIKTNPLANHKSLKVDKKVQIPFSSEEVYNVIALVTENTFAGLRDKLLIELLYSTGMRRIELINLKESDINLAGKSLKVLGKRNKERFLPILQSVFDTLTAYLKIKKSTGFENEYLLLTDKGEKLYETLVYRLVNLYFSRVSSKTKKSPHILRHSFATHLLNEGADFNSVKELLGHASLASTQVYTHNSLDQLKKVFNQAHPRSSKNKNL